MPIPTIKYNNLSSYGKIPTCKSCSYEIREINTISYIPYRVLMYLEIQEERKPIGIEEIVNTTILH